MVRKGRFGGVLKLLAGFEFSAKISHLHLRRRHSILTNQLSTDLKFALPSKGLWRSTSIFAILLVSSIIDYFFTIGIPFSYELRASSIWEVL